MKLSRDDYEFRNHEGRGFCWGSAVLASYSPGLIHEHQLLTSPTNAGSCRGSTADRVVEAFVRDETWDLIPEPVEGPTQRQGRRQFPFPEADGELAALVFIEKTQGTNSLNALFLVRSAPSPHCACAYRLVPSPTRACPSICATHVCASTRTKLALF